MSCSTLPGRASDAGPDHTADPLKDWIDHLDEAADEVHDASRLTRDDLKVQRKLRLEAIIRAIDALRAAIEVLP